MDITSETHKSHKYHYQSLIKRTSSKSVKPTKRLGIFTSNNKDEWALTVSYGVSK